MSVYFPVLKRGGEEKLPFIYFLMFIYLIGCTGPKAKGHPPMVFRLRTSTADTSRTGAHLVLSTLEPLAGDSEA